MRRLGRHDLAVSDTGPAVAVDATPIAPTGASDLVSSRRLSLALLGYALALAVFLVVPPTLRNTVDGLTGFTWQELLDLFTPLAVLPVAAAALRLAGATGSRWTMAILVVAIVWVEGQAIHLAANGIDDAAREATGAGVPGAAGEVTHWLDERLSHWLWDAGWVGLSGLFLAAGAHERLRGGAAAASVALVVGAAVVHGLIFGITTVEGVTALLGIPASAVLLAAGAALVRRGSLLGLFLAISGAVTLGGYAIWAALNEGTLPEPCTILTIC